MLSTNKSLTLSLSHFLSLSFKQVVGEIAGYQRATLRHECCLLVNVASVARKKITGKPFDETCINVLMGAVGDCRGKRCLGDMGAGVAGHSRNS